MARGARSLISGTHGDDRGLASTRLRSRKPLVGVNREHVQPGSDVDGIGIKHQLKNRNSESVNEKAKTQAEYGKACQGDEIPCFQ